MYIYVVKIYIKTVSCLKINNEETKQLLVYITTDNNMKS